MSFVRDLALDSTGDLAISGGDIQLYDDTQAIIQTVKNRMQFWQGEWFIDTRQGMPYFTTIFSKNANLTLIKSIFSRAISGSPGIAKVISVDVVLDRSTRTLTVSWQAQATTGVKITQQDNLIFPGNPAVGTGA